MADMSAGIGSPDAQPAPYNILLEYGERDLDEYLAEVNPPYLPEEIHVFWGKLIDVARALLGVHTLDGEKFSGWHADLKPSNILLVQDKFKLADPGFAKIVPRSSSRPKEVLSGGTWTYAAPERTRRNADKDPVGQEIDIWSLGCVFSIAATWIVGGYQAVKHFQQIRIDAGGRGANYWLDRHGDIFHNGQDLHREVIDWHQMVASATKKYDDITEQVLNLVNRKMLVADPIERGDSKDVCSGLDLILTQYKPSPSPISGEIRRSLYTMDIQAQKNLGGYAQRKSKGADAGQDTGAEAHQSSETIYRKEKRWKRLDVPFRPTAGRSESIEAALPEVTVTDARASRVTPVNTSRTPTIPELPTTASVISPTSYHPRASHSMSGFNSPLTSPITNTPPQFPNARNETTRPRPILRMSSASEQLEQQRVRRISKPWESKYQVDPFLAGHFHDRDIYFLVDNADTMTHFWADVKKATKTLVGKCAGIDRSGIDVYFTMSTATTNVQKDIHAVSALFKRSDTNPQSGLHTNMRSALGRIFAIHLKQLEPTWPQSERVDKVVIYVLTDGRWRGTTDFQGLEDDIARFHKEVKEKVGPTVKDPVGLQFIRFDSDDEAKRKLDFLDDDLAKEMGIEDFIDVEHVDGDVYKMLLGSFVPEYDHIRTHIVLSELS